MPYIVCKHPVVCMDIMVLQQYWPRLVSIIQRTGCTYDRENWEELPNGDRFIILRNVEAKQGKQLGELIGLLYGLEWQAMTDESLKNLSNKFYILLKPKKRKGKKHDQANRQEAHTGGESGNRGESAGDIRHGEDHGPDRGGNQPFSISADDLRGLEVLEGDDDHDQ